MTKEQLENKIEQAFQGLHFTDKLRDILGDNGMQIFVLRLEELLKSTNK